MPPSFCPRLLRVFAFVGTLALAAAACDDGPSGPAPATGDTGAEVPTLEAFADAAAKRLCERAIVPCCSNRADPPTQAACEMSTRSEILSDFVVPGMTYSVEGAARCLDALLGVSCTQQKPADGACDGVVRGPDFRHKQGGETCTFPTDCAAPIGGDASCYRDCPDGTCEGTSCVIELPAVVGAACDDDRTGKKAVRVCGDDAQCVQGVCVAYGALGEPCLTGGCAGRARCDASGVCVAYLSPGAACTIDDECEAHECDARTKTCTTNVRCD